MRKTTTKFFVATLIALGVTAPVSAQDYKISLGWDAEQTAEQNYIRVETKIAKYCSITARRQSLRGMELSRENQNCQSQLMDGFVKKHAKDDLTQYHSMRHGNERLKPETKFLLNSK